MNSSPQEIVDILYEIPRSQSNIKVAVDDDLSILYRYAHANDCDNLLATWIQSIINSFPDCLERVIKLSNPASLSHQELSVNIAKAVPVNRNIVVDDVDDYHLLAQQVKLASIKLLERKKAQSIFCEEKAFDYEEFTNELIAIAHRLTERKHKSAVENWTNDIVVDLLRNRGYGGWDQSRSGRSGGGLDAGELDICHRNTDGVMESIIEAFRLSSCGEKNEVVTEHLDKLINNYDTTGLARNFVLIYAESKRFSTLWAAYKKYVNNPAKSGIFGRNYPLESFTDVSSDYNCKVSVRVGIASHTRDIANLEIFHIFINMCAD